MGLGEAHQQRERSLADLDCRNHTDRWTGRKFRSNPTGPPSFFPLAGNISFHAIPILGGHTWAT